MRHLMNFCTTICWIICLPLLFMKIVGIYGIYKRLFPLLAYNITFSYNEKMHENKRDLFRNLNTFANANDGTLRLLEIGCGSGANFKFYPYGCTGGAMYFLEHVVSDPTTWTYFLQHVLQPLWYYLGDGCVVTRATWKDLEAAGFSNLKLKHIEAPQVSSVIRPHILGYAIK